MSTTFGIFRIPVQTDEYGNITSAYEEGDYMEIAYSDSKGIQFFPPFYNGFDFCLKDSVPVFALDNANVNIHTIGDIKKAIKRLLEGQKEKKPKLAKIFNPGFLVWCSLWPKTDEFEGFEHTRNFPRPNTINCEKKYLECLKSYSEEDMWDALKYEIEWRKENSKKSGKNELKYMNGPEPYLNQRKFEPFLGKKRIPKEQKTATLLNPDDMFL